jgi:23S rRNA (uracil1939-C5)-methyltransferase
LIVRTQATLAVGGDAVAHAPDGRIIFIEGAAPEEEVRVAITKKNPRFLRARVLQVVTPSPHRVEPRCRHFAECGGCVLQHVAHASQVASKQASMVETMRRIGGIDLEGVRVEEPWSGEPYRYRTRVRFFVERGKAGYKRAKSNEVFDAAECPILAEPLERLLVEHERKGAREVSAVMQEGRAVISSPTLFAQANEAGNAAMIAHLDALLAESGPFERALEVYGGSGNFTRTLAGHAAQVTMVEANREATALARTILAGVQAPPTTPPNDPRSATPPAARSPTPHAPRPIDPRSPTPHATPPIDPRSAAPPAARQVDPRSVAAPTIAPIDPRSATPPAARQVDPRSVAAPTIAPMDPRSAAPPAAIRILELDAEHAPDAPVDVVLVDPPRAGMSEAALERVARAADRVLLYVSCDPATFARDAKRLAERRLALDSIRLFDLYPQTAHAEVVGRFRRTTK